MRSELFANAADDAAAAAHDSARLQIAFSAEEVAKDVVAGEQEKTQAETTATVEAAAAVAESPAPLVVTSSGDWEVEGETMTTPSEAPFFGGKQG